MEKDVKKSRQGKLYTVKRNFNGTLTAEEYIAKVIKAYIMKEDHKQ